MVIHEGSLPPLGITATGALGAFRRGYDRCFTRRAGELFELTDALLCTEGKVTDLAHLSLEPEHHRGDGALDDAVNAGEINTTALKTLLGTVPVPKTPGPGCREGIVLAVEVSNWLRPEAGCSPGRAFCHTYARNGQAQMIPGWPYSFVAALEPGATSWTAVLDVAPAVSRG